MVGQCESFRAAAWLGTTITPSPTDEKVGEEQRVFWKGRRKTLLLPLVVAFAVFAVTCLARMIVRPGEDSTSGESALYQPGRSGAFVALNDEQGTTYDEWLCTDPSNFVMQGADLVAFFSLQEDDNAVMGSPEYASIYEGYRFLFSSAENKALFQGDPLAYIPAYGGFCAWGIAQESYWNKYDLGPPSSPDDWMITADGMLLFFRNPTPKEWFAANLEENIRSGDTNWNFWFGDKTPGASYLGSPLNTNCFCSADTC